MVWVRQIRQSLIWLVAFMDLRRGAMHKAFHLRHHYNQDAPTRLVFDTCCWGLGATIYVGEIPFAYFSSALTTDDERHFRICIGDNKGQQLWEALAMYVALRLAPHLEQTAVRSLSQG